MFGNRPVRYPAFLLFIIIICLVLAGCSPSKTQPIPIPIPSATPTPTPIAAAGGEEPGKPQLSCPKEDTLFSLWFDHLAVLDIDGGNGETIHLEEENIPPSFFDLWIYSDGTISNEGIFREAPIGYHGTAIHPDDNDCPVQTFDGVTQMKGTITGTCKDNLVRIHIVEEWIDPTMNSDCGSGIGAGPGLYSGPELDLIFDLNDPYPSDGVQIPEGGSFYATYTYYLWLAGYELPVIPLVPERE
jgi:hypothetical protein